LRSALLLRHSRVSGDLWEVRQLPGGAALELRAGERPALVLAQGENRVSVELAHVKAVVAALVDGAADSAQMEARLHARKMASRVQQSRGVKG
jgi:hypothetical protein